MSSRDERVRRIIRRAIPGAEERISYQIPTYTLQDRAVIYFAGWKEHYSFYPVTVEMVEALGAMRQAFDCCASSR
jgi:uncharacterized protein YdhG (YjbR/CyaY superfamily)